MECTHEQLMKVCSDCRTAVEREYARQLAVEMATNYNKENRDE